MDDPTTRSMQSRLTALAVGDPKLEVALRIMAAERKEGFDRAEMIRLLKLIAPRARRNALRAANPNETYFGVSVIAIKEYLDYLDAVEPMASMIMDLHYAAGLRPRIIGQIVNLPPNSILRELRLQKSILKAHL